MFETDSLRDVFAGLRTVSVVVTLESLFFLLACLWN